MTDHFELLTLISSLASCGQAAWKAPDSAEPALLQVIGRNLAPAALFFEVAGAAVQSLLDAAPAGSSTPLLVGGTLPAPKLLPSPAACQLECRISMAASAGSGVQLSTPGQAATPHMQAGISAARSSAQPAAQPVSALRLLLPAQASKPAASVLGSLSSAADAGLSQAAVLDSCLHLGASAPSASSGMRVPAGFAVIAVPAAGTAPVWAGAGAFSVQPDGSALSSYAAAGFVVSSLLARPMAAAAPASAAGISTAAAGLQYVIQSAASEPASQQSGPAQVALVWHAAAKSTLVLSRSSAQQPLAGQVLGSSLRTLALLQISLAAPQAARVQLLAQPDSSAASQAAAAMLRTAAQEHPAGAWGVLGSSALSRCALLGH